MIFIFPGVLYGQFEFIGPTFTFAPPLPLGTFFYPFEDEALCLGDIEVDVTDHVRHCTSQVLETAHEPVKKVVIGKEFNSIFFFFILNMLFLYCLFFKDQGMVVHSNKSRMRLFKVPYIVR